MASDDDDKRWFPLESNPVVMNQYIRNLGFPTKDYRWHDLLSTEDWALEMIPQPAIAVMMLFPIKQKTFEFEYQEEQRIKEEGQLVSENVYFMKQTVANACGTVGILHAVMNVTDRVTFAEDSFLSRFLARTRALDSDGRADALQKDDEIEDAHESAVQEGQSEVPDIDEPIITHFVAFVHRDGHLYELDGRKEFPINHGPSSPDTFLKDACAVVSKFMQRDPEEVRFTILALAPPNGEEEDEEEVEDEDEEEEKEEEGAEEDAAEKAEKPQDS
eukprot:GILI01001355.1.p1 GENE.GILI01001355.1~~GILI01001355.1.p1  ORF type:complete len:308 (+),score=103.67 GILI01001355.1:105-926(+)